MRKLLLLPVLLSVLSINVHAQTLAVSQSQTDATCFGMCNGTASVNPTGGTPPYTFVWSHSAFTSNVGGLCAGVYSCVVTDNVGASVTATFVITEPTQIVLAVSTTDILCYGACTGSATVTATGGTTPYVYNWDPTGGTGPGASGMCAGSWTCTITDNNGCTSTITMTITQPPAWSASASVLSNVTCNGGNDGAIAVSVNGYAPPYSYAWSPSGSTSDTVTNLSAGTQTCTVTDSNGCTAYSSVTIIQPPQLVYWTTVISPPCYGSTGSVIITCTGGFPPYSGDSTYAVFAGTYVFQVSDATGCSLPVYVTVNSPPPFFMYVDAVSNPTTCGGNDGSVGITVAGGTSPYTYAWNNNAISQDISGLTAGSYYCLITDANGCSSSLSANLTDPGAPNVYFDHPVNVVCQSSTSPFALSGYFPSGGTFSGPGVTGNIFDPVQANIGTNFITYSYTNASGCTGSDGDTIRVEICTEAPELNSASQVVIYPNPASGVFSVTTEPGARIIIYNSLGSIVVNNVAPTSNSEISLSGFAEGIYLVVVEQNNTRSTGRVVLRK